MYPARFDYVAPPSLEEALQVLSGHRGAKVLAGGHSLLPLMKLRFLSPELVVDIGRIPELRPIRREGAHLMVGATATHAEVAGSELVRRHAPALAEAASWVGDPQVRNRGTVGGAVAHADPSSDEPAAVLALGGVMLARSAAGGREIAAEEFFVDTMTTALGEDEILTGIRLPLRGSGEGSAYDKLGRRGGRSDFAVAGAAAWVRLENGVVAAARVALTGVGPVTALAPGVAEELVGTDGSAEAVGAAARRAPEGVTVLEDLFGGEEYKTHLARVYVRKALLEALARARA